MNNWLESAGHTRRDRSVIAIGSERIAEDFGNAYMIFPIGKFNYSWVTTEDWNDGNLSGGLKRGWNIWELVDDIDVKMPFEEMTEKYKRHITTNKGFRKAYNMDYEIWMDCKQYYFVAANIDEMEEYEELF